MKFRRLKRTPLILALSVLALVCGIQSLHLDFLERLERMTYDMRVRAALKFPAPAVTNFAFVAMEDSSIKAVKSGRLGYRFGLLWPRQVYGRLVDELATQGANLVDFDVLFGGLRPDQPPVQMADGRLMESDAFFAEAMHRAGDVVLAATPQLIPPPLFATNALALGDISTEKDSDGVLRRARAFRDVRIWHPLFKQLADNPEIRADLSRAKILPGKILLPQMSTTNWITVPIDSHTNFSLADFLGTPLPPGVPAKARAFTTERLWQMGIVVAAQALHLDLAKAIVDLPDGKIILPGTNGVRRVIPVDSKGNFLVDWRLTPNDPRLLRMPIEELLWQNHERLLGKTNGLLNVFRNKIVFVGSAAQGNDLTDRGATPLQDDTLLVSKHWNIANAVITNQFIRRATDAQTWALIIALGLLAAFLTWQLRALAASIAMLLLIAGYVALAFFLFVKFRFWLPLVLPLLGGVLLEHLCLVSYRVVFEEREQRRVKSVFSKIVSPDVVNELLQAEKLSLGGTRREVTVLFADIRGFTKLTDQLQEQATEYVGGLKLEGEVLEKYYEESARETLETVNLYLAAVADAVKNHAGTLDKYIGDCVMAFWNAPTLNSRHAVVAIDAAIEAQRAIHELNEKRLAQNPARATENRERLAAGLPPKPLHTALQLGTGINTGAVTVGLMGSDQHILNYTVFGREVNLASRLEGVSGSGRIIISDATHAHLLREAPGRAAECVELDPVTVKGIRNAVRIFEVPWRQNK